MRTRTGAAAVLLLSAALILLALPQSSAASPSLRVAPDQGFIKLDFVLLNPDPARGFTLVLTGNVSIAAPAYSVNSLTLTVDAGGWSATISPQDRTTTGNETFAYRAAVEVPGSAEEGYRSVTVRAYMETPDGVPVTDTAISKVWVVRNWARVEAVDAPSLPVKAGWNQTVHFVVTNIGGGEDTIMLSVAVPPDLAGAGMQASVEPQILTLQPEGWAEVTLNIAVPSSMAGKRLDFAVKATSTASGLTATVPLSVQVARPTVAPAPGGGGYLLPLAAVILVTVVGVALFMGGTEVGLFAFLSGLLPLFVRLKREQVLDRFVRGQIFGFIRANPGAHFTAIKENLSVENGVLTYHLSVLMREGLVTAARDGLYRRFYPAHERIPEKQTHLSRLQRDILEALRGLPGLSQVGLASKLSESKQVVHYNVKVLEKAGLVRVERDGNGSRCHLTAGGEEVVGRAEAGEDEEAGADMPAVSPDLGVGTRIL